MKFYLIVNKRIGFFKAFGIKENAEVFLKTIKFLAPLEQPHIKLEERKFDIGHYPKTVDGTRVMND